MSFSRANSWPFNYIKPLVALGANGSKVAILFLFIVLCGVHYFVV